MPSLQVVIQNLFRSKLRKEAMEHLAKSPEIVASSFRGEYQAIGAGSYKWFLEKQEKNAAWGTYIEAVALAEKYKVHLVVTPVKRGVPQNPICLYRSDAAQAKTAHLYNSDNTHWYFDSETKGDGNCLYNAYAQALFNLDIINADKAPVMETVESSLVDLSIFSNNYQADIRARQEAIEAAINEAPTVAERQQDFEREKERISKLPPNEQKQIADDHAYALRLAQEECFQPPVMHAHPSLKLTP
ncbi:OTU domain-containing protein [Legionella sp. D16C41]|uniref:OTU domain-containing protein n=1 Tax=Legionella sp. D16C41 TaxID=3402688 RepID=UPI003AF65503